MGIRFVEVDDAGDETEHDLPSKYEVCDGCRGKGSHVNRAIDGDGLTAEDFAEDPDFEESYFRGDYDVQCEDCGGLRVQEVVDEEACPADLLALYFEAQDREAMWRRVEAAERRMGA